MSHPFEDDPMDAPCGESNDFFNFDGMPEEVDPLWSADYEEMFEPNAAVLSQEDSDRIQSFNFQPCSEVSSPMENDDFISDILQPDSAPDFSMHCVPALVKIEVPPALFSFMPSTSNPESMPSSSIENQDPLYPNEKLKPKLIVTTESPVVRPSFRSRPEFQIFDDPSGLFPNYRGWYVVLSTPYGTLVAEKKIPVGTIMYARNRLVYVWIPQKHFDKLPVLVMGELSMPHSQCGEFHSLCFKRPYSKSTTLFAPNNQIEFFICMDPRINCRSNAHKTVDAKVTLSIAMDEASSSNPLATYCLSVQSYDSQAKSKVLSGILCMAFFVSGAAGTIWKSMNGDSVSAQPSSGRVLLSVESQKQQTHHNRCWTWMPSCCDTIADILMGSSVGDFVFGLLLITSFAALIKSVDFRAATRSFKESVRSGRILTYLSAVGLFYLVTWRCYTSTTSPTLSSVTVSVSGASHHPMIGLNISPISLVVLLFSAHYFLSGEQESPQQPEDEVSMPRRLPLSEVIAHPPSSVVKSSRRSGRAFIL